MPPQAVPELLAAAVREATRSPGDDEAYWAAVRKLWDHADVEVLEAVYEWAASKDSALRELVPDVLRALGSKRPFREETLRLFAAMLDREKDPSVIAAIGFANTGLNDERMAELFLPYVDHEDANIREAAVHALGAADASAIEAPLVQLSRDPVVEVRSWATFYLSALPETEDDEAPHDSRILRAALWERTKDADAETRAEAVLGLALRGDEKVLKLVTPALAGKGPEFAHYVEAAALLGEPALHPELLRLLEMGWPAGEEDREAALQDALDACSPNRRN